MKKRTIFYLIRLVGKGSLFLWAVYLFLFVNTVFADWSPEILIWENPPDVPASHPHAVLAVDSFEHVHIVYTHVFYREDTPQIPRLGFFYQQRNEHGELLVPNILISDSNAVMGSGLAIRIWGQDSLIIFWRESYLSASFQFTTMDLDGNVLRPAQIFAQNHYPDNSQCFDLLSDGSIVFADAAGVWDSILVTVERPDGSRPLDETPVWTTRPCDRPTGAVDHTDSLQLAWRQFPSWNAVFGKRVSTEVPLDPDQMDEHVEHTPRTAYWPFGMYITSDTTFALAYGSQLPDGRSIELVDIVHRDDYSVLAHRQIGLMAPCFTIEGDSVFAAAVVDTVDRGRLRFRRYDLPSLELIEEDSVTFGNPAIGGHTPFAVGVSTNEVRHLVYSWHQPGTYRFLYRYWRSDLAVERPGGLIPESDFRVWPNPTNGELFVSGPLRDVIGMSLYNILGRRVYSVTAFPHPTDTPLTMRVSGLPTGSYYLHIATRGQVRILPVRIVR